MTLSQNAKPQQGTDGPTPSPNPADEPELTQEESVPTDGKDTEGEKLIEQLGRERRQEGKN